MYDTYLTIMGRVITEPRCTQTAGGELMKFRVACNSRKMDKESGQWSDGRTLYVAVSCWGKVAIGCEHVIKKGSVIVAHGRIHTDEFVGNDGGKRSDLAMDANNIGLDLSYLPSAPRPVEPVPQVPDTDPWSAVAVPESDVREPSPAF